MVKKSLKIAKNPYTSFFVGLGRRDWVWGVLSEGGGIILVPVILLGICRSVLTCQSDVMKVSKCLYCLNCPKFGQLIPRKIINIVATRCQIFRLKCTKFERGKGRGKGEGRGKGGKVKGMGRTGKGVWAPQCS